MPLENIRIEGLNAGVPKKKGPKYSRNPIPIGTRFGKLVVVSYAGNGKWACVCDCGNEKCVAGTALTGDIQKSCGCGRTTISSGDCYNDLTAVSPYRQNPRGAWIWKFQCSCGSTTLAIPAKVINGIKKDCGHTKIARATSQLLNHARKKRIAKGNAPEEYLTPRKKRDRQHAALSRTQVFERDNYTCQLCGKRGGILNVHHVYPVETHPHLVDDIRFQITLCARGVGVRKDETLSCHDLAHPHGFTQGVCPEVQQQLLRILGESNANVE